MHLMREVNANYTPMYFAEPQPPMTTEIEEGT